MSGIAAIIHFDGRPAAHEDIAAMTRAMAQRGPDGITHCVNGSVALGHCMMRTTTESLDEAQPLVNARRDAWLVVDGWLDNWEELRAEVLGRGGQLRDRSDAELILAAYELWGEDCVVHMGGDFAFVIWDAKRQTAFCARDRVGNKPLVYWRTANSLVVASEPAAILALPWVPREINEGLLVERLADEWLSRDETLWTGVLRLVAAHRMSIGHDQVAMDRYWEPDLHAPIRYKRDEDYFAHYRELFLDCVRRASRSHRPIAYEVSGGLDSSAVFCAAKHLHDRGRIAAPGIHGYTLDFSGDAGADEIAYARAVRDFLGMPVTEISPAAMTPDWYLAQAREHCELPTFPNGAMMLNLRRRAHADGSRVILNGGGGDEWLEGSRSYYADELSAGRLGTFASCAWADIRSVGLASTLHGILREGIFALLPSAVRTGLRGAVRAALGRVRPDYWLSESARDALSARRKRFVGHGLAAATAGQRELLEVLHWPRRDWARETENCLHAGDALEGRRPMDTPAMVQFALSTPARLRLRGATSKFIHVKALRGLLPAQVLDRNTKADFASVMREPIDRLRHWFAPGAASAHSEFLDGQGVSRLFGFYERNPQAGWPLWVLWMIYGAQEFCPTRPSPGRI